MEDPLRILLVDDHTLFRRGVAALLTERPDLGVVGEASDGLEAVEVAAVFARQWRTWRAFLLAK
jgi:DNA-binding NarL/FixJ family response regulator